MKKLLCLVGCCIFVTLATPVWSLQSGELVYTTQAGIPIKSNTSLAGEVLFSVEEAGASLTWLGYAPADTSWSRIRMGNQEGFVETGNLLPYNPLQNQTPIVKRVINALPEASVVLATAATRAFAGISPGAREYAQRTNRTETLRWLVQLGGLEQSISLEEINQHNLARGVAAVSSLPKGPVSIKNPPLSKANPLEPSQKEVQDMPSECAQFVDAPITEEEARQLNELSLVGLANRYGDFLKQMSPNLMEMHKHMYEMIVTLASRSKRLGPYRVFIANSKEVNAFSTIGGDVVITRGLLEWLFRFGNENELSFILGHEIKHIITADGLTRWRDVKVELCNQILRKDAPPALAKLRPAYRKSLDSSCNGFLNLDHMQADLRQVFVDRYIQRIGCQSYEDDLEKAADIEGLRLSVQAHYKPMYKELFSQLQDATDFSNHPKNSERIQNLDVWMQQVRPTESSFGYPDWPFDRYSVVTLPAAFGALQGTQLPSPAPLALLCRR